MSCVPCLIAISSLMLEDFLDSWRALHVCRRSKSRCTILPQRDAMYVAGSEDEASLGVMFSLMASSGDEESRPLCPLPLTLREGEWVDWTPPKNHALRKQFDDLESNFLGELYAEQKGLLDEILEVHEDSLFVSGFTAVQMEGSERVCSYCVWSQGVDAILPRTQVVVFMTEDGLVASGEWEHVVSVVGDLIVADDAYYPTRYRVREFPSDAQLAAIGEVEPFVS